MAYNYEYPYVGTDEYNDDWLLKKVAELAESYKGLLSDWQEFKTYVENYLNNINVPEEVQNIINQMADDGRLQAILESVYLTPFIGKHTVVIGDSISAETGNWVTHFKTAVESINGTVDNISISGTAVLTWATNDLGLIQNADNYIFFLGVNDFQSQVPFFAPGNGTGFLKAWDILYNRCLSLNPSCRLWYISPIKYYWDSGIHNLFPLMWYRRASELKAAQYGATIISGYGAPLLSELTQAVYLRDKIHPTPAYSTILADYFMRSFYNGTGVTVERPYQITKTLDDGTGSYIQFTFYDDFSCSLWFTVTNRAWNVGALNNVLEIPQMFYPDTGSHIQGILSSGEIYISDTHIQFAPNNTPSSINGMVLVKNSAVAALAVE